MYDGKEMEKWKNGTANTNFLDLRSWIYLLHRFSTLAPNMLLRISYGLREKDSLIDDEKKKTSREKILSFDFCPIFSTSLFFLLFRIAIARKRG